MIQQSKAQNLTVACFILSTTRINSYYPPFSPDVIEILKPKQLILNIVNRETGYETLQTSMAITKVESTFYSSEGGRTLIENYIT